MRMPFVECNRRDLEIATQVAICCFDKTGTLTSDNLILEGLTGLTGRGQDLVKDVKQAGAEVLRVMASCQSLIQVDGNIVGDPLEKASFQATGANVLTSEQCSKMAQNVTSLGNPSSRPPSKPQVRMRMFCHQNNVAKWLKTQSSSAHLLFKELVIRPQISTKDTLFGRVLQQIQSQLRLLPIGHGMNTFTDSCTHET